MGCCCSKVERMSRMTNLHGLFGGSGTELFNFKSVCKRVLDMVPDKGNQNINVLLIGAATYDIPEANEAKTKGFLSFDNVSLEYCLIAEPITKVGKREMKKTVKEQIRWADVIFVGGGNTLYLHDRMKEFAVDTMIKEEMNKRKLILCGGSAGAIIFFDSGHSDSGDSATFRQAMIDEYINGITPPVDTTWRYIRTPAVGFLPGMICPHADKIQSNGVLRLNDFKEMIKRHIVETGVAINHYSSIMIQGEDYQLFNDKPGDESGSFGIRKVWLEGDEVMTEEIPQRGHIDDIFIEPGVIEDPLVEDIRRRNV